MNVAPSRMWRVFCAVEIPESVRQRVLQHVASLRAAVPDAHASWSRDPNLHLTLKFLGEISQTSVQKFSNAASRAVVGCAPFTILLGQTGAFPKDSSPRVLWIGVNDAVGKLAKLHARLEDESVNAGFKKEERDFNPHLTVARLRQPRHARTLVSAHMQMGFEPAEITVSELLVIRSELGSEGSKYTVISRHPLEVSDKL
ncbi:MAG TPA: RNA 2',3'-cyclic phosphodiesterase [Blastocatellia bacterium]|nr:RNA 2',3'-cyclic phosphodiesterase [Blastocatellia bacterium]HAF21583.1 RNA 2',3'-cyclic phosphodiesterase [Blastocatellia bacterium]